MDGKLALYNLRQLLEEDSNSGFLDDFTSYNFLNEAAIDLAWRTKSVRNTQSITTVAAQASYDLNADYMGLYLQNSSKNHYLKYNDGDNNTFITWKPFESIVYSDRDDESASIPDNFSVIDKDTLATRLTGTTTAAGAASGGECTLTDSSAAFSDVYSGDIVHNTTDGSMGIVLSKTSTTALVTALFGGTNDDWTSGDSYVIQPQGRYQLIFNPKTSTAGHTVTVYYLQRPTPVFSDYGVFKFPFHYMPALIKLAAWMYKYRDKDPNFGDKWYIHADNQIKKYSNQADHALRRKRFTVNFKATGR